jgi:hypothetical protein
LCDVCAAKFSTEVVADATVICAACGSPKVQEQFNIDAMPTQKEEQKVVPVVPKEQSIPTQEVQPTQVPPELPQEKPIPTPDGLQPQK